MKSIKTLIKLILILFLIITFGYNVSYGAETKIDIKLTQGEFNGYFTDNGDTHTIDNILYIDLEDKIGKNYVSFENKTPRVLGIYKKNQKDTLILTGQDLYISCEDSILLIGDYRLQEGWLGFSIVEEDFFVKLRCKNGIDSNTNPDDAFDFKEKDAFINDELQPFSISSQYGNIQEENVSQSFLQPNPSIQPKFVDIVFLQSKTISNLMYSLSTLGVQVEDLFENSTELNYYKEWLKKYSLYTNKQVFVDSFEHSVALKDIGMANDIVEGLTKRLLCEYKGGTICSSIKISFSKKGGYEFYTLDEIIEGVFGTNRIGDATVSFYVETQKLLGNFEDITNPWAKRLIESFFQKTYGNLGDLETYSDYNLGYGLQTRIDNLLLLKDEINANSEDRMNILGLYNFYFEVNNIMKGQNKVININAKRNSDELKEVIEEIIIKENINEKMAVLGDDAPIYMEDIGYKIQKDVLTMFNLRGEDVIFEFICGNIDGNYMKDYINTENIKTYEDYYNVLYAIITIAYDEMIITNDETYTLSFNMSHLKRTSYEDYFVLSNDCIFISDDPLLVLWYDENSTIYNNDNVVYISDHSNKNNIGYKSSYPESSMPSIEGGSIYFDGTSSLKIFDSYDINLGTFDKRTIEIDFTTFSGNKTQVLYDEGNNYRGLNIFIKDGKLYAGGWDVYPVWTTLLSVQIKENIDYKVKLVLDASIQGESDGLRMYLDSGNGMEKVGEGYGYSMGDHYLTRIGTNTWTRYNEECISTDADVYYINDSSCAWTPEDGYYFYGKMRSIKVWNAVR